jgi:hypothetical protein
VAEGVYVWGRAEPVGELPTDAELDARELARLVQLGPETIRLPEVPDAQA